jgi:hypothetical protein
VARGGAGTPRGYAVRSNADSFATNLSTADVQTVRPTYTPISIDLTGAAFQNLSSLTFRVYSYSPAAGSSLDYDNIVVNGNPLCRSRTDRVRGPTARSSRRAWHQTLADLAAE